MCLVVNPKRKETQRIIVHHSGMTPGLAPAISGAAVRPKRAARTCEYGYYALHDRYSPPPPVPTVFGVKWCAYSLGGVIGKSGGWKGEGQFACV